MEKQQIDTLAIVSELRRDVLKLQKTKDPTLVNDNIFGDCIYAYLDKEFDVNITPKEILNNLNKLFDKYFTQAINEKTINKDVAFFVKDETGLKWIETYTGQEVNCIRISITINNDIFEHSRLYWFIKKNSNWLFYGLTCTG
ncbi:hypothetical protein [Bacteroides sp. 519]|uniref:hypothetical protein n=1 Tax=Bacteroides sp. 519 TaxID=2302937 RepID=UPI0013D56FED|nr:hypothetical protein [Bacteroides sp. 519]NDV59310.1 hypothetical protein [Bacteroides sp. 519]